MNEFQRQQQAARGRINKGRWAAEDRIEQGMPVGGTRHEFGKPGANPWYGVAGPGSEFTPADTYAKRRQGEWSVDASGKAFPKPGARQRPAFEHFRDVDSYQGMGRGGMFTGPNRYYQGFHDPTVNPEDRKRRLNEFLRLQGLGSITGMQ